MRAVVRVTSTAGRSAHERAVLSGVDHRGPMSRGVSSSSSHHPSLSTDPIVVEASSPGFAPATLTIPTSVDPADTVLAVASAGAGQAVNFFGQ